jgi:hypothetical protein
MSSTDNTPDVGTFFIGWFVGMMTAVILFMIVNKNTPIEIHTDKRIQPEKRLTTDGKTVDTLFIYKQER